MEFIGDIHIYVSDFTLALRFWADGLGLEVSEQEVSQHSAYARLDFEDGGPSVRLIGPVGPAAEQPASTAIRPTVRFDVSTDDFDATLLRLIEHGGTQLDEIASYKGLRAVSIADPDGNVFELLELPPEEEEEDDVEEEDAEA